MMRRTERPPPYKTALPVQRSRYTVDLGAFDLFRLRKRRQDGRNSFSCQRLSGAGRTDHQKAVHPGRCHCRRTFDALLSQDFRKVRFPRIRPFLYRFRFLRLFSGRIQKKRHHFTERFKSVDPDTGKDRPLPCVGPRKNAGFHPPLFSRQHMGQCTVHASKLTLQ